MKNLILNGFLTVAINLVFILLLLGLAWSFHFFDLRSSYVILFVSLLAVATLPLLTYFHGLVDSIISPIAYEELFIQTVDSILNIESFDEMLKAAFDQVLELIRVRSGFLIFYYHDKDEFNIFYQRDRRSRIIRNAKIENDNILFRVINSQDDIIIRDRLDSGIHFEKQIIEEMDKFSGEIIIPIYYHEMFLGLIVVGHRKKKFSEREMRLLKIFASRIAILSVNSFFFNELRKKKELEKEYEIAAKIQKRFIPDEDMDIGPVKIRVFHQTASVMTREFYDIFVNDAESDDVRISAYRLHGNITGTSIYMPVIQALLQTFSRLGHTPSQGLVKLKRILREKNLMDEEISVFHASVRRNGEVVFVNNAYQAPFLYRRAKRLLYPLRTRGGAASRIRMQQGDILLVPCENFSRIIGDNLMKYSDLIAHGGSGSLGRMRNSLARSIMNADPGNENDRLLIALRIEGER